MLKVGDNFCIKRNNNSFLPPAMEIERMFRVKEVCREPVTEKIYYKFSDGKTIWRVFHFDVIKMGI